MSQGFLFKVQSSLSFYKHFSFRNFQGSPEISTFFKFNCKIQHSWSPMLFSDKSYSWCMKLSMIGRIHQRFFFIYTSQKIRNSNRPCYITHRSGFAWRQVFDIYNILHQDMLTFLLGSKKLILGHFYSRGRGLEQ